MANTALVPKASVICASDKLVRFETCKKVNNEVWGPKPEAANDLFNLVLSILSTSLIATSISDLGWLINSILNGLVTL